MQTFLPYPTFTRSAQVLDRARLGKQRVETLQIMKAMCDPNHGWKNHPAVKMWDGYAWALLEYQKAICKEWTEVRGYKDTCLQKTWDLFQMIPFNKINPWVLPPFISDYDFNRSHRSNLLRKNRNHYSQYWDEPDNLPYIWSV